MNEMIKVTAPYDGKLLEEIPVTGPEEAEKLLSRAHELFRDHSRRLPPFQRVEILEHLIGRMTTHMDALIDLASEEGGKPREDSRVEALQAIHSVKLAIQEINDMGGEEIPMGMTRTSIQRKAFTFREPIGVVLAVNAFNEPLSLVARQAIPAIAAGAPAIIKPSSRTPLSCLKIMELLEEAGLPGGWCTTILCRPETTEKLAADPRLGYFSFIGTADTGWRLRSKLAPGVRCSLAHGSAAPVIVEPDAPVDETLPLLAKGGFYHAGQVSGSVQRVYVHNDIADTVCSKLKDLAENVVVGDPLDRETQMGPLIGPEEVERVDNWVKEAEEKGGKILCGGKPLPPNGYAPTIILDPPKDAAVSTREIFGPVICVYTYSDRGEAIDRANALPMPFQASVFTGDLDTAMDTVDRLDASAVMVNEHPAFREDWMPFGGWNAAGLGMGGIRHAVRQMTREKLMVIRSHTAGGPS